MRLFMNRTKSSPRRKVDKIRGMAKRAIERRSPLSMLSCRRRTTSPLRMLLQLSPLLYCSNPNSLLSTTTTTTSYPSSISRASQSHHPLFLFCNNSIDPLSSSSSSSHTQSTMTGISRCFFSAPIIEPNDDPDPVPEDSQSLVVVSFYKFADFPDHAHMRKPLKDLCQQLRVSGGIILAPEGINGSICGTRKSVERVLGFIQSDNRLKGLRQVESPVSPEDEAIHHGHGHSTSSPLAAGEDAPFRWDHVRVKLKKEIVTLGMPSVSPIEKVGTYVNPRDWNALISDPDTVVIDVRNDYETRIGKFKEAVDPCTTAFREFPSWVEDQFQVSDTDDKHSKGKEIGPNASTKTQEENPEKKMPQRVAMYCTGGIRCEKASSYLLSKGFKEVYHLEGGILKYLEEVPKSESLWEGECFVFDKRVSVGHSLVQGTFKLCYGCKQPVSDADMESPEWEYGVSCPYCYSLKSDEEKERARARQRQFEAWGIIGGPDKGRRPTSSQDGNSIESSTSTQLSDSA